MPKKKQSLQDTIDGDINLQSYGLKVDEAGDIVTVTGVVDTLSERQLIT